jgi:hypothetical protein
MKMKLALTVVAIAFAVLSTLGTDLAEAWQVVVAAAEGAGLPPLRVEVAIVLALTGMLWLTGRHRLEPRDVRIDADGAPPAAVAQR